MTKIAIIGSGIAGHNLAKEIRKEDANQTIDMFSLDSGDYYYKPNLSAALSKQLDADALTMETAANLANKLNLTLHANTSVTKIDTNNKILFAHDTQHQYDKLVFATGANPIALPSLPAAPNTYTPLTINTLDDYRVFRQQLPENGTVTFIGAGLIACELANDLIANGYQVNIVALSDSPMDNWLPKPLGDELAKRLTQLGVNWFFKETVQQIDSSARPLQLTLQSGHVITSDIIVSAIGLKPNIGLAAQCGIATHHGILTDNVGQTQLADHYALGDCAEFAGQVRLYVAPILATARAMAKTLCDTPTPIHLPTLPLVVKTPCFPIQAILPPVATDCTWQFSQCNDAPIALAYDKTKQLRGFILTCTARQERAKFSKQLTHHA